MTSSLCVLYNTILFKRANMQLFLSVLILRAIHFNRILQNARNNLVKLGYIKQQEEK